VGSGRCRAGGHASGFIARYSILYSPSSPFCLVALQETSPSRPGGLGCSPSALLVISPVALCPRELFPLPGNAKNSRRLVAAGDTLSAGPPAAAVPAAASFWQRRVVTTPVVITQAGSTPDKIALTLSLGLMLSNLFRLSARPRSRVAGPPSAVRLNQSADHIRCTISPNPLQIALLIPFYPRGRRLLLALPRCRSTSRCSSHISAPRPVDSSGTFA